MAARTDDGSGVSAGVVATCAYLGLGSRMPSHARVIIGCGRAGAVDAVASTGGVVDTELETGAVVPSDAGPAGEDVGGGSIVSTGWSWGVLCTAGGA